MYSVTVRNHVMIAHSLSSKVFGPAQNLHGATYVIDAEFKKDTLDKNNLVIDIALAAKILEEVAARINYRNLDELEIFQNAITTTEFLAKFFHSEISKKIAKSFSGILKITLHESHVAWASYEGEICEKFF